MAERSGGFLEYFQCYYSDSSEMSGESPDKVSREQLLLLVMMFSKVISVPPLSNSVESFAWGKVLVHSVAFFQPL